MDTTTPVADLLERVAALQSWSAQWNDADASPPSDETIEHAKQWIKEMYCEVSSSCVAWLDPMITVSEEGEVTFEWWNADRKLTVYVSGTGATYTKVTGRRRPFQLEDGPAHTSPKRREL